MSCRLTLCRRSRLYVTHSSNAAFHQYPLLPRQRNVCPALLISISPVSASLVHIDSRAGRNHKQASIQRTVRPLVRREDPLDRCLRSAQGSSFARASTPSVPRISAFNGLLILAAYIHASAPFCTPACRPRSGQTRHLRRARAPFVRPSTGRHCNNNAGRHTSIKKRAARSFFFDQLRLIVSITQNSYLSPSPFHPLRTTTGSRSATRTVRREGPASLL
jgi:hypothetical protein